MIKKISTVLNIIFLNYLLLFATVSCAQEKQSQDSFQPFSISFDDLTGRSYFCDGYLVFVNKNDIHCLSFKNDKTDQFTIPAPSENLFRAQINLKTKNESLYLFAPEPTSWNSYKFNILEISNQKLKNINSYNLPGTFAAKHYLLDDDKTVLDFLSFKEAQFAHWELERGKHTYLTPMQFDPNESYGSHHHKYSMIDEKAVFIWNEPKREKTLLCVYDIKNKAPQFHFVKINDLPINWETTAITYSKGKIYFQGIGYNVPYEEKTKDDLIHRLYQFDVTTQTSNFIDLATFFGENIINKTSMRLSEFYESDEILLVSYVYKIEKPQLKNLKIRELVLQIDKNNFDVKPLIDKTNDKPFQIHFFDKKQLKIITDNLNKEHIFQITEIGKN